MVQQAKEEDVPAWLDLAREVGELFGANMADDPEFLSWLKKNIDRDLVQFAQNACPSEVRVTTFGQDHPDQQSVATRAFFFAQGFHSTDERPGAAPDGTPREVLVWRKK